MGELTSTLGGRIVDSGMAASVITLVFALAMVTTRQPSRRRALARAGVLGALLAIPLVYLRPYKPFEIISVAWVGVKPALVWFGDLFGIGTASRWEIDQSPNSALNRYLPFALLGIYFLGVFVGLCRFVLGWWGAGWIRRNSTAASAFAIKLYNDLPYAPGRPRPGLRVSSRTRRPVLLGTFRETILIPPQMDAPEHADALRLTLLHELAHAEASDPWFGVATELAAIFWFPLPPLWWIRRQMRLDQEYLADRQAASRFGPANQYAASLVDIAASSLPAGQMLSSPVSSGQSPSALLPRVLMLIRCPFLVEGHPPHVWLWFLTITTGLILLSATAVTIHVNRTEPVTTPQVRSFSMPSVVLADSPTSGSATTLPIRLPASFSLSFSVHATKSELAQITVIGVPLAPFHLVETTFLPEERRWHKVRLNRATNRVNITLNNEKPLPHPNDSFDESLAVRSMTGRRMTFRSLLLTW